MLNKNNLIEKYGQEKDENEELSPKADVGNYIQYYSDLKIAKEKFVEDYNRLFAISSDNEREKLRKMKEIFIELDQKDLELQKIKTGLMNKMQEVLNNSITKEELADGLENLANSIRNS